MLKKQITTLGVILVIVLVGIFAWFKLSRNVFEQQGQNLSKEEVAGIVTMVRRHIRVPANEEPLVATIVDVDALVATQPFYQGAENGDVLLIYQSMGKAILYSPDDDILINVGPIIFDEEATELPPEETVDETVEE